MTIKSDPPSTPSPKKKKLFPRNVMFGVVLIALALLTVGSAIKQMTDRSCQTNFNTRSAVATVTYRKYADEDRQALVAFLKTLNAQPSPTPAETDQALQNLLDTYDSTQDRRDANPLPSLAESCG